MLRGVVGAVKGLFCGLMLVLLSMFPTGGGHGWLGPVAVSLPGIVLFAITGILLSIPVTAGAVAQARRAITARVLTGFMIVLDAALVAITIFQARDLMQPGHNVLDFVPLSIPWAAMWAFWHWVVITIAIEGM